LSVEDQGSRNGVFVNGLQMRRSVLYSGDVVRVGNYEIVVRQGSSGPAVSSSLLSTATAH
jgi:pSer/pThr/pTyr-binding forkhead associated (FHA) protein